MILRQCNPILKLSLCYGHQLRRKIFCHQWFCAKVMLKWISLTNASTGVYLVKTPTNFNLVFLILLANEEIKRKEIAFGQVVFFNIDSWRCYPVPVVVA